MNLDRQATVESEFRFSQKYQQCVGVSCVRAVQCALLSSIALNIRDALPDEIGFFMNTLFEGVSLLGESLLV